MKVVMTSGCPQHRVKRRTILQDVPDYLFPVGADFCGGFRPRGPCYVIHRFRTTALHPEDFPAANVWKLRSTLWKFPAHTLQLASCGKNVEGSLDTAFL